MQICRVLSPTMRETPHLQYIRSEKEKGQKTKKERVETVALQTAGGFLGLEVRQPVKHIVAKKPK